MQRHFAPNGRNSGGKYQIERLQQMHVKALLESRPSLGIKPPHPHVDVNKPFSASKGQVIKRERKQDFSEVNETYRRVKQLRSGYCDVSKPKTMAFREQLRRKNKVSQKISEQDHMNNVRALMNNIVQISERSNRKVQQMRSNQRIHSIASSIKETSRIGKKEWDERSSHPLEYEWKAKKRPYSAASKSKSSAGETLMSNYGTLDSSSVAAKRAKLKGLPMDYMDAVSGVEDEEFLIGQTSLDRPSQHQYASEKKLNNKEMIYDKYEKREKGVVIPLIGPAEKMNDVKRKIYQTLVEYKLFQRHQIYQIGQAYVNQNEWLDENEIMEECNKISKQLYGID